jgi:hypothetical protein
MWELMFYSHVYNMFRRSLFVILSFFFGTLCCLSSFVLRILITPLVSSNSFCWWRVTEIGVLTENFQNLVGHQRTMKQGFIEYYSPTKQFLFKTKVSRRTIITKVSRRTIITNASINVVIFKQISLRDYVIYNR